MQRIWNALIYGDFETRKSIGSVMFFSILGIGFIIASGIMGKFAMFIIGMLLGVVALIISQTFTLVDDDFVAEVGKDGKKESVRTVSVMKNGVSSSKSSNTVKGGTKKTAEEKNAAKVKQEKKEQEKEQKEKKQKEKEKQAKEKQEKEEKEKEQKEKDKKEKKEKKEKDKKTKDKKDKSKKKKASDSKKINDVNDEEEDEIFVNRKGGPVLNVDQKELKKLLRKYRVKKDHRPIIIDNSVKYSIKECPAFIWRAHNDIYLLLLEKEPRKIKLERGSIKHVDYAPSVRGNRQTEYLAFQKSNNLIVSTFEGFIPDYFDSVNSRNAMKVKHLYEIAPDIQISNRSIAAVMDLLVLNFMPDDKYTQSDKFNRFFKRIYAANLMYKDRAYSITEYKESVEKTLMEMCYEDLPYQEFQTTLENMVRARFISQEYADHYTDVRSRVARQ